jgi:hypothetical protein
MSRCVSMSGQRINVELGKLKEPGRTHLDTTDDIEAGATQKKDRLELRHVSKWPLKRSPSMLA